MLEPDLPPTTCASHTAAVIVRRAGVGDLPILLAMVHALANHHGDRAGASIDDLRRDLFGGPAGEMFWGLALLATAGDEAIGYAILHPRLWLERGERGMEIHHLFVVPHWRERGVGKRLVDAALDVAARNGCSGVTVGAHPDNAPAHRFYPSVGFDATPPHGPRFKRAVDGEARA